MSLVTEHEDGEQVITATLIRGQRYTFNHVVDGESKGYTYFERAVPKPVSEELADALEEITEEVPDGDGDLITKDVFKIDRNTPMQAVRPVVAKKRLRLVEQHVEEKPILRAPARKPVAAPTKKPGTFGRRTG